MKKPQVSIGIGKQHNLKAGERIFSEGDSGSEMYVVQSGHVRIFLSTPDKSITLTNLKKGDFFGEMALLEKLPRSASAEALDDVELISLGPNDFKFLIQQHPEIAMKVLAKFSTRLRDADHLIELLLLGDTTGNVIHTLVRFALLQYGSGKKLPSECQLSISKAELAKKIKLPIEKVNQVLEELDRMGLASVNSKGILIRQHRKLRHYLEYLDWKGRG